MSSGQSSTFLYFVQIIGESWREVLDRLMAVTWKNSYSSPAHSFEHFDATQIQSEIVKLAKDAGFEKVETRGYRAREATPGVSCFASFE